MVLPTFRRLNSNRRATSVARCSCCYRRTVDLAIPCCGRHSSCDSRYSISDSKTTAKERAGSKIVSSFRCRKNVDGQKPFVSGIVCFFFLSFGCCFFFGVWRENTQHKKKEGQMTPDDGKRDGATNSSLSFPFTFPTRKTTVNRQCCLCSFLSLLICFHSVFFVCAFFHSPSVSIRKFRGFLFDFYFVSCVFMVLFIFFLCFLPASFPI